uniref:Uncharacterized protein n=1 Tax=Candidatus Kentrum sp. UNK TaxID=2126344 RepID=A0A451AFQ1_9GAMM|nr:MAG: hypothetical protein BECKUNK1418G_GA0071005_10532 [Candidatus Kentron sp. UNK]VFK71283.1 MAG: hypothetical protein BECKUNK1418H_GA0071006_105821 [Candidatus Kentron sp. UNK]
MSDFSSNIYTSGRLYLNSYATGSVGYRGDQDWFRIYLRAGQRARFDLEGSPTGRGSLRDTYLRGIYMIAAADTSAAPETMMGEQEATPE